MGRLLRLELENFKSYNGHHVIGPFDNFTAIMGPNGVGKSNLMDAISFVLGIHSTQLRSTHLSDLIYRSAPSGSQLLRKTRRRGASGMNASEDINPERAFVSMFLGDDQTRPQVFTRSITLSGHSEYRIDNTAVAYTEYVAALSRHNILIRARNFLVFQGDVEAVAAKSPKDLTRLVEQICGSDELKNDYDKAKEKMERTMEASTFAFHRKRGINAEIRAVHEQKEEVAELVTEHMIRRLYRTEQEARLVGGSIESTQAACEQASNLVKQSEAQIKEAKKNAAHVQKDLLAIEKQLKKTQIDCDGKARETLTTEEQHRFVSQKFRTIVAQKTKLESEMARQRDEIRLIGIEFEQVAKAATKFEETSQATLSMNGLSPAILAEYQRRKELVALKISKEQNKLDAIQRNYAPDLTIKAQLEGKLHELDTRQRQLEEERLPLRSKAQELDVAIVMAAEELTMTQRELINYAAKRKGLEQKNMEVQERLQMVQEKLLQAKADRHESERELRFRAMLEQLKRLFPGVHGRIIDLCQPTQHKYESALAIVFGRNIDTIVVDHERVALDCIKYMREQHSGQATFIPLDTIQSKPVPESLRTLVRGARPAIDVVNYESAYARAIQYACGSALVCDSLDVARYVCYEREQRVKAVTLDGTVIHKSGLITGGGGSSNSCRRWEEKEVHALKTERAQCLVALNEFAKAQRHADNDEQLKSQLIGLETRSGFLTEERQALGRRLRGIDDELEYINVQSTDLNAQLMPLLKSLDRFTKETEKLSSAISIVEDEVFATFCSQIRVTNIREYEQGQIKSSRELADKKLHFTSLQSKLSNQLAFLNQQFAETARRLTELLGLVSKEEQFLADIDQQTTAASSRVGKAQTTLEGLQKEFTAKNTEYERINEEIAAMRKSLSRQQTDANRLNKEVTLAECQIEKLLETRLSLLRRCKLEEIDLPLRHGSLEDVPMTEHEGDMSIPVVLDYSRLSTVAKDDDEALEHIYHEKIKAVQLELEQLMPNLRALDKLEGVESRLRATIESFDRARDEAKAARDEFLKIKNRRYQLFYSAFKHIAAQIDIIYKELTKSAAVPTGGTAYLSLEESEEPYLEGIRFHAMPPLKRFLDMEQLSGGEKTVAALALLFAVHSYRPAPFFILDEVDAALDNENVQRVAAYLCHKANAGAADKQEKSIQFLVISLKGSLYEQAESLVGVYRDSEVKSSKILTLRLSDYPE